MIATNPTILNEMLYSGGGGGELNYFRVYISTEGAQACPPSDQRLA